MASFLDNCLFNATSTGTGDFVVATAVTGAQTPANAKAINAAVYRYKAYSADQSQWEVGYGAYTVGSVTLARTTVLFNSAGTQAKISFSTVPLVALVALAEDVIPSDGSLFGLTLSTAGASTTFTTAAGWATDSTAVDILRLYSSLAKTTGAWAVGNGNGGWDSGGANPASTAAWYSVYLIKRPDTGVVDVIISQNGTAAAGPNLPTNYTIWRRIGSIKTNGSFQWVKFSQLGDEFLWDAVAVDASSLAPGVTTAQTLTLTVPLGEKVRALIQGQVVPATDGRVYFSSLDKSDEAAGGSIMNAGTSGTATSAFNHQIRTNTSGQIRFRLLTSTTTINVSTEGWIDSRGKAS